MDEGHRKQYNYVFPEKEAKTLGKNADTVISCLLHYIENLMPYTPEKIIFCCDNCGA